MFSILLEQKLLTCIIIALLLLSILCQIIIGVIYQSMIHETDNMSETKNKQLKQCKLKFNNCFQLNGKIANISIFVDKFIQRLTFMHVSLNSLSILSSQLMLLSILASGIGICIAIVAGETLFRILPYYLISIFSLYIFFSVSGFVASRHRREILKINLMDYLENHMLPKLEQQSLIKKEVKDIAAPPDQSAQAQDMPLTQAADTDESSVSSYQEEELESLLKELFI